MDQDKPAAPSAEQMAAELLALMPPLDAVETVDSMREHLWSRMVPVHEDGVSSIAQVLREVAPLDAYLLRVRSLVLAG